MKNKSNKVSKVDVTVAKFAEWKGIDKVQANAVLKFLVHAGVATVAGKVETGKKGKPAIIYNCPQDVTFKVKSYLKKNDKAEAVAPPAEAEVEPTPTDPTPNATSAEIPAQTEQTEQSSVVDAVSDAVSDAVIEQ